MTNIIYLYSFDYKLNLSKYYIHGYKAKNVVKNNNIKFKLFLKICSQIIQQNDLISIFILPLIEDKK